MPAPHMHFGAGGVDAAEGADAPRLGKVSGEGACSPYPCIPASLDPSPAGGGGKGC